MITRHLSILDSIIIIGRFPTVSDLKDVVTTSNIDFPHLARAYTDTDGEYYLDKLDTTSTESLPDIIVPTTGTGVWKKINSTLTDNNLIKILSLLSGNSFNKGGNIFGTDSYLGLNDNFTLNIGVNGSTSIVLTDTKSTIQSPNTNNYIFADNSTGIYILGDNSFINVNDTTTSINLSGTSGPKLELRFNGTTDEAFFIDSTTTPKGIQYNADYSATFTDYSLVNKGWVNSLLTTINYIPLSGTTVGNSVTGDIQIDSGKRFYYDHTVPGPPHSEFFLYDGSGKWNKLRTWDPNSGTYPTPDYSTTIYQTPTDSIIKTTYEGVNESSIDVSNYYISLFSTDFITSNYNAVMINQGSFSSQQYQGGVQKLFQFQYDYGFGISTNGSVILGYLKTDNITLQRTYQLPDNDGIIALTSDLTALGSTYIKVDGSSPATTGFINIGDNQGFKTGSQIFIDPLAPLSGYYLGVFTPYQYVQSVSNDQTNFYNNRATGYSSALQMNSGGFHLNAFNGTETSTIETDGTGLNLRSTISINITGFSGIALTTNSPNGIIFNTGSSKSAIFKTTGVTGTDKILTVPNASGTIALTSDLSAYVPIAGNSGNPITNYLYFNNFFGLKWGTGAGLSTLNLIGDTTANTITLKAPSHIRISSGNASNLVAKFTNLNGWNSSIYQTNNYDTDLTVPNASGTIALTSDLTGLGSTYIKLNGSSPATTGVINIGDFQGFQMISGSDYTSIYIASTLGISIQTSRNLELQSATGFYKFYGTGSSQAVFNFNSNTVLRTYTFPNTTGTIALLSDIPSLSGYLTFSSVLTGLSITGGAITSSSTIISAFGALQNQINSKQNTLVSGTSLKTVAGVNLLGSGDVGIIPGTYGGTGINNGTNTITIGGNLAFTGAFNSTFAIPQSTTWTLPNTSNDTLAGLGTTNVFSVVQRFAIAGFTVNDGVSDKLALNSPSATSLLFGSGFINVTIGSATTTNVVLGATFLTSTSTSLTAGSTIQVLKYNSITSVNTTTGISIGSAAGITGTGISIGGVFSGTAYTINATSIYGSTSTPSLSLITTSNSVTSGTGGTGDIILSTGVIGGGGTGTRGSTLISGLNLVIGTIITPTYQSMVGGTYIANATTVPTGNPSGGLYMYSSSGDFNIWTSGGGKVTLGAVSVFPASGIAVFDGVSNALALNSPTTSRLNVGSGYNQVGFSSGTWYFEGNNIRNSSGSPLIRTGGVLTIAPDSGLILGTQPLPGITSVLTIKTGSNSSATASSFTGDVTISTGDLTNASTLSSQFSGSLLFDVGTVTGGVGTRGGVAFFNSTVAPAWNSMQRGFFVGNATAIPTGNPTGGLYMYSNAGDFNIWTSSGGKVTLGVNSSLDNIFILDADGVSPKSALDSVVTNVLRIGAGYITLNIVPQVIIGNIFPVNIYSNNIMGASSGGQMSVGVNDPTSWMVIGTMNTATTRSSTLTQPNLDIISIDNTGAGGIGGIKIHTGNHNNATVTTINGIDIYTGNILNAATVAQSGDIRFDVGTAGAAATRGSIAFFNGQTSPTWNSMQRGFFIGNATAVPTGNPTGGLYMYASSGDFKIWTSAGGKVSLGAVSDFNDVRILDQDGVTQRLSFDSVTTNILRIGSGWSAVYNTSTNGEGAGKYMLLDTTYKDALTVVSSGILGIGSGFTEVSLLKPITQFKSASGYSKMLESDLLGNPSAVEEIVPLNIYNYSVQALITTSTNWSVANVYTGSSLSSYGLSQGQVYFDANYRYEMADSVTPVRIPRFRVEQRLFNDYVTHANTGSTETTLISTVIPANTLNKDKDSVVFTINGGMYFTSSADLKFKMGSTPDIIFSRIGVGTSGFSYVLRIKIVRTSSNNQKIYVDYFDSGNYINIFYTTSTYTDTADIPILITGKDSASNKVDVTGVEIDFKPSI